MKSAVILCSGGLDSVTTAHYVKNKLKYDSIKILFFNYVQRNLEGEEMFAKICADEIGAEFMKISLDWLGRISDSLINSNKEAKKLKRDDLKDTKEESNKYYVPCRNTLFLTYALAYAESLFIKNNEKSDIFVGFKCEGKESYPDATKTFLKAMNKLGKIGCSTDFKIIAPLIEKDKEDIISLGIKLGIDFTKTLSCYIGPKNHCGVCLACKLRQEGFYWANVKDPTIYGESSKSYIWLCHTKL